MIISNNKARIQNVDVIYLKIQMGQSNAVGRAQSARLQNTMYNYEGISTGYPTARASQPQYPTNGIDTSIYIYSKDKSNNPSGKELDNGSWVGYTPTIAGTDNVRNNEFCSFLSFGRKIKATTGKSIFCLKISWGATALSPLIATALPGSWASANVMIATQYYIQRAIRDLKALYPTRKIVLLPILWWQGETDGINNVSKADYKTYFLGFKKYIEKCIYQNLALDRPINWSIVKIHFTEDASETTIRDAQTELVSENANMFLINIDSYPKKNELTVDEASPITKGSEINSEGGEDDRHMSYIGILAVGELDAQICIDNNLL